MPAAAGTGMPACRGGGPSDKGICEQPQWFKFQFPAAPGDSDPQVGQVTEVRSGIFLGQKLRP